MKQKNKILIILSAVFLLAAITSWVLGHNPVFVIALGLLVLFMFYVLWDMPPKHKTFSYKDQQRAMRAFDRSEQIDMGKPDWAKDKKKYRK
jgi:4-hydroxybenzoate polyprenyltransferase